MPFWSSQKSCLIGDTDGIYSDIETETTIYTAKGLGVRICTLLSRLFSPGYIKAVFQF